MEMTMFLGRTEELRKLSRLYAGKGVSVCLIHGRRRVGKSTLIRESFSGSGIASMYYACKESSEQSNTESLAGVVSDIFPLPSAGLSSFEALLDFIFRQAADRPALLALDEYPYLRKIIPGIDSILQSLIDKYRETSRLKLILYGSFVEVMKSLLLESNPLFGRIDQTIGLKAMDYLDSALFYPNFCNEDKVRLFSVFGGIPHFNALIDPSVSVKENIQELVANRESRLENEIPLYLRTEITKIANANKVFEALSRGFCRFSDILSQSKVSSSPALADILERLVSMEVVEKTVPINDERNRRKTSYRIADNLSRFFFRYIDRYGSQRAVMESDAFYAQFIEKDFETSFVPLAFETICRQFLIRQNRSGRFEPPLLKIGKYYYDDPASHANGEFDVVAEDETGYVFFEAKFRKDPLTQAIIDREIAQVRACGLQCSRYGFFSRSGFSLEARPDLILFSLADLYGAK